jgi:NADH-quinone oxidoreductase subunit H
MNQLPPLWPANNIWLHWIVFSVIILAYVLAFVIGFIWFERRAMARMQSRVGPNRLGPFGLLQPIADAVKVLVKEDIMPMCADQPLYFLAPIVAFAPVMMIFAVVPFDNGAQLVDLNVGVLYVVAVSSITSLGIFMAGWASDNKYTILGAMRDIASVVSYEIPLVLALAGVTLLAGSMSLNTIVLNQKIPYILLQPLGFVIAFLAGSAEINRAPFDLLEADSELVAGFHTEYSGMKFALFYLVEYAEALVLSSLIATFFLAGWKGPLLPAWLWFLIKVVAVFFLIVWVRTTVPRIRIDQMMGFAWKFLLPLSVVNLLLTGLQVLYWPAGTAMQWVMVIVNIIIAGVLIIAWSRIRRTPPVPTALHAEDRIKL